MDNVLQILRSRGLLDNVTSQGLDGALNQPLTMYAGFDPTSNSLQVGNFVAIMGLAHFQRCGHRVIALVGGATGMIGDPSGKTSERALLSEDQVQHNLEGIRENLSRFLDFNHPTAPAMIVNNQDWFRDFAFVDFLREVGKHFRMGTMLGKDSVRSRLESETGMSFTEFSYQLLQAYDFLHLYDEFDCMLQLGGSDQWGNITAGTDLIRKLRGAEAFGMTLPLVCDRSGQKFGKSAGNAIYLDATKTSVYDFYQFFLRVDDEDVIRFLKVLTFLSLQEIDDYAECVRREPEQREAQKRLAEEVTKQVHGEEGLQMAKRSSMVLFGESMDGLKAHELLAIFAEVPSTRLPLLQVLKKPLVNVVADTGLCASRGDARRLIRSGGLYVNNQRVADENLQLNESDIIDGQLLVLRSGKKRYHLVSVDE